MSEPRDTLIAMADEGRADELELEWMEAVEEDRLQIETAVDVLYALSAADHPDEARALGSYTLSEWAESKGPRAALRLVTGAARLLGDSEELRRQVADLYARRYAEIDGIEAMARHAMDRPLAEGVERMERMLELAPGTFVADARRSAPGQVVGVHKSSGGLEVAFGESKKVYDAPAIDKLERLPDDDFRALVTYETERLAAIAEDDPARLVRMVLEALGPRLAHRDLKDTLAPVIPGRKWSRWWKKEAAPAVARSPILETTDEAKPTVILRNEPLAYERQVERDFEAAADEERLAMVREHLARPAEDPETEDAVLAYFAAHLAETAERLTDEEPGLALAAAALLHQVRNRRGEETDELTVAEQGVLDAAGTDPAALGRVTDDALVAEGLAFAAEAMPQRWPAVVSEAMPALAPAACDDAAEMLIEAGHADRLSEVAERVISRSADTPGAMIWLWKQSATGDGPPELSEDEKRSLAIGLLRAADALKRAGEDDPRSRYAPEAQRVLSARDYAALQSVLKAADEGQARSIRVVVERNEGLTDLARGHVMDLIRRTHPKLYAVKELKPWEDEEVIYTTADALQRKREQLDHLLNVRLPENSKAIGDAADLGDLSENAEFTAALEERERLTERANALQSGLAKAESIPWSLADSDTVSVGSAVVTRDPETGAEDELTFLGPWDSNPEEGVYFYRTPIGLAFMGKGPGDVVTLELGSQKRRWEIVEVRPGI